MLITIYDEYQEPTRYPAAGMVCRGCPQNRPLLALQFQEPIRLNINQPLTMCSLAIQSLSLEYPLGYQGEIALDTPSPRRRSVVCTQLLVFVAARGRPAHYSGQGQPLEH